MKTLSSIFECEKTAFDLSAPKGVAMQQTTQYRQSMAELGPPRRRELVDAAARQSRHDARRSRHDARRSSGPLPWEIPAAI